MPLFKIIYILTIMHGNFSIAAKIKIVKKVFREIYKFCFEKLKHSSLRLKKVALKILYKTQKINI